MAVTLEATITAPSAKGTFIAKAETLPSFKENPSKTVKEWGRILKEDISDGKSLEDYRILKIFQNMSQEERNAVAAFIRTKYPYQPDFPPGKICLSTEKDGAEAPLEKYTPRHLLVLLYPTIKENKPKKVNNDTASINPESEKIRDEQSKRSLGISSGSPAKIIQEGNKKIIGEGDRKITFIIPEGKDINDEKLLKIYDVVTELNEFIPSNPLKKVYIVEKGGCCRWPEHEIEVPLTATFLDTATHEMGHAIFNVLLEEAIGSNAKLKEMWQRYYYYSLGNRNYELVDDSNYSSVGDMSGHPFDNPSELFASSVAAFRLHPDKFIQNILDPNTPKEMKRFGKLIWCFLRDKVFKGNFFSKTDPFKNETAESLEIKYEEIVTSLLKAFDEKGIFYVSENVRIRAMQSFAILGIKDKRFVEPLIKALGDESLLIREAAAMAIGKLGIKDERFIEPLIAALDVKEYACVRSAAAKAIGELGIKHEGFVELLITALNDKKVPKLCRAAAKAIANLKDPRFHTPLLKALGNDNYNIREAAALALGNLKDPKLNSSIIEALKNDKDASLRRGAARAIIDLGIKDKGFVEPLIMALNDKDSEVRQMVVKAIGELDIKHEGFVEPLIKALSDKEETKLCGLVIQTIKKLGIKDKRFIKPLAKLLREETIANDSSACISAADFLGETGDKTIIPTLKEIIELELYQYDLAVSYSIEHAIKKIEQRELAKTFPNPAKG